MIGKVYNNLQFVNLVAGQFMKTDIYESIENQDRYFFVPSNSATSNLPEKVKLISKKSISIKEGENRFGLSGTEAIKDIKHKGYHVANNFDFLKWAYSDSRYLSKDEERAIVCHFLGANPSIKIRPKSVSYRDDDPPDCEAIAEDGQRIGVEVTKLVEEALMQRHRKYLWPFPTVFKGETLLNFLQICLNSKARTPNKIRGGPYSKLYLIIDVQQPFLSLIECKHIFQNYRLERPQPWDVAFLVFEPLVDINAMSNMPYRTVEIPFLTSQEQKQETNEQTVSECLLPSSSA